MNDSFARTYFAGRDPIGQRIRPGLSTTEKETPWREIVGVVADIKHGALTESDQPAFFVPFAQGLISPLYLIVRTAGEPAGQGVAEDIRKALARKDPELALYDVKPLDAYLATSVASERFETLLLAVFAGLGLTLTAVGLYGVVAYGVAQRTREFGIRLALGARSGEVLGMVVRSGLALAGIGLAVGVVHGRCCGAAAGDGSARDRSARPRDVRRGGGGAVRRRDGGVVCARAARDAGRSDLRAADGVKGSDTVSDPCSDIGHSGQSCAVIGQVSDTTLTPTCGPGADPYCGR